MLASRRFRSELERLLGGDIGATVVRVRANVPSLPHRRPLWHSDVARDDGSGCSRIRVTAWIPLSDAHRHNGTLEVAEGLKEAPLRHERLGDRLVIDDAIVSGKRTVIECAAGQVAFLDRFTPHRAVLNRSTTTRWALAVSAKPVAHV